MTRNILIVAAQASGGVVNQIIAQCRMLDDGATAITVAAPELTAEAISARSSLSQVRFIGAEIGARPSRSDRDTIKKLAELAADAEIVHAHGARAGAMASLALRSRGRKNGTGAPRLVVTLHNRPVGSLSSRAIGYALIWLVAMRAHVVLAVSKDLVTIASAAALPRRITQLIRRQPALLVDLAIVAAPENTDEYNSETHLVQHITSDELRREHQAARYTLGIDLDEIVIVTVARLAPQKGLDALIDAAEQLKMMLAESAVPQPWRWLIVGDGPLETHLRTSIEQRGLSENVTLLGRRRDIRVLNQAATVVVNCAIWEGQSVALMEALDAGAAIVATDVGGTSHVLGGAGRLVKPHNPTALADCIAAVVRSPYAPDQLRLRARTRASELPRAAQLANQLETIYTRVTRNTPPGSPTAAVD